MTLAWFMLHLTEVTLMVIFPCVYSSFRMIMICQVSLT